jgi:signal-transduction protein with cAMP-binding, CBS, and nucleotidyltransferase domain
MVDAYSHNIRTLSMFTKMTANTINEIAKIIERKVYYQGETLLEKNTVPSKLYMIMNGRVVQSTGARKGYNLVDNF